MGLLSCLAGAEFRALCTRHPCLLRTRAALAWAWRPGPTARARTHVDAEAQGRSRAAGPQHWTPPSATLSGLPSHLHPPPAAGTAVRGQAPADRAATRTKARGWSGPGGADRRGGGKSKEPKLGRAGPPRNLNPSCTQAVNQAMPCSVGRRRAGAPLPPPCTVTMSYVGAYDVVYNSIGEVYTISYVDLI
jgi:hypothetical protein